MVVEHIPENVKHGNLEDLLVNEGIFSSVNKRESVCLFRLD